MKKNNKKGFTLAELLIVVAIIAVLVAISIPIFTAQLEKARDAVTIANLRSAYAEAAADMLTTTDTTTTSATKKVASKGTQAGFSGLDTQLPFTLGTGTKALENTPKTYDVTFTWAANGTVTATVGTATVGG